MNTHGIDAFILAAGLGMRARPLSLVRPKPLFPLGGVPLIRLLLDQLRQRQVQRVFINLFYRGTEIRNALRDFAEVCFVEEKALSGSRILAIPRGKSPSPMLVVNGDVFLEIPLQAMWREYRRVPCDGVLLVRPRTAAAYSAVNGENGWYRGRTRGLNGHWGWMYCGAGLFSPRFTAAIRHGSLFDSLEQGAFRVRLLEYAGIWLDLGTPGLYHQAQFDYIDHAGLPGSAAWSGTSRVDKTAALCRSILWDKVEIGAATRLDNVVVADGVCLDNTSMHHRVITMDTNAPL